MKILGIDTILHSTCAAVVEDGRRVLSNICKNQAFASDKLYNLTLDHLESIGEVIRKAIETAKIRPEELSLITVNNFGSQISNVLVGISAARVLSRLYDIPVLGVHHQEAHLFSCWLERKPNEFRFPIVVLSSSGGHSAISLIKNRRLEFKTLLEIEGMEQNRGVNMPNFRGIGAVYGLVAFALGLGKQIGGAPMLSEVAKSGNPRRFNLFYSRPAGANILDFKFLEKGIMTFLSKEKNKRKFSRRFLADFAASFEYTISEIVLNDFIRVAKKYRAKEIHLVGGISANRIFRQKLPIFAGRIGAIGRVPVKTEYSTDNAAMIASLGYYRYKQNPKKYFVGKVPLISNLRLEKMAIEQIIAKKSKSKFYNL